MYSEELPPAEAVTLRVDDLRRTRRFYQDLLGLVASESGDRVTLESAEEGSGQAPLVLIERSGGELDDASWVSVQVDAVSDVLDLYLLATMLGAKASLPRRRGERWNTVVQDPDGHRLSIWTAVPPEGRTEPGRDEPAGDRGGYSRTRAGRSPRWVWEEREREPIRHRREREEEDNRPEARPGHGREEDAALSWAGRTEERAPRG